MKHANLVLLTIFLLIICHNNSIAGSYGKEGNRAIGVVYKGDAKTLFKKGEATIEIIRHEDINDSTNDDGVYYIVIPKDISKYQLVYRAKGYWSQILKEPISNDHDPEKIKRIILRKRSVSDSRPLQSFIKLLGTEEKIYRATKSTKTRQEIKLDLKNFLLTSGILKTDAAGTNELEKTLKRMP